ncbi:hypothetical protein JDV09_12310 [Mycobacterium sp. Y57]|uniref:hypothetical protein n=1 Tax=Mycolicibacterium xanthum TaxID=2796469 RepID=UPI001C8572EC|nr:hypothetical protein [Mycolicibacterium xanthum]MBX7432884.1 hypothetical protein [Mycolicibacterium xanthum]
MVVTARLVYADTGWQTRPDAAMAAPANPATAADAAIVTGIISSALVLTAVAAAVLTAGQGTLTLTDFAAPAAIAVTAVLLVAARAHRAQVR